MSLTRKHFNALADIVNDQRKSECVCTVRLANAIADFCEQENPRFNRDAFIEGCGLHFIEGEGWVENPAALGERQGWVDPTELQRAAALTRSFINAEGE